jgi:hypothetical protein
VTIQELGSIGEFVAAVATLITLVYLALQIKHNTKAIDLAAERGNTEDASRWRQNLIQQPEVAELYRKGMLAPASLEPVERLRFRMLLDDLFDHWTFQSKSGTTFAEGNRRHVAATLETPGGAAYWDSERSRFSVEFVGYVDSIDTRKTGEV